MASLMYFRLEITLEKVHQGVEWSSLISTCDSSSGGVKGELPLWRNVLGLTENEMKQLTDRLDATCRDEVERNEGKRVRMMCCVTNKLYHVSCHVTNALCHVIKVVLLIHDNYYNYLIVCYVM